MLNHDIVFNDSTKTLDMVSGDDAIPQTIDHYLLTQLGDLICFPDFGIDLYGIMTSSYPQILMLHEIKLLKEKLGFATFSYTLSEDGRQANIEAQLEKTK